MKSSTKAFILGALLLLIQGCGFQFWYNRLAWVSTWYADDYVTLTSSQEERLEALVERHASWHRVTQLPRYNQFINQVITDLKHKRIEQNYDSYNKQLTAFYHTVLDRVLDDAVDELAQLSNEQVEELLRNLKAPDEARVEQYKKMTDEDRLEANIEEAIELYEEWLDDLTTEQEKLIKDYVKSLQPTTQFYIEYRKRWHEAFALALAERQSESGKKALYSLLRKPSQLYSEQLKDKYKQNRAVRKNLQLQLFRTATDDQIEHFIEYLSDYKEDFSDLIADAD